MGAPTALSEATTGPAQVNYYFPARDEIQCAEGPP